MLYVFGRGADKTIAMRRGRCDENSPCFVELVPLEILGRVRDLFEVNRADHIGLRSSQHAFSVNPTETVMVHVDSIKHLVRIVPHNSTEAAVCAVKSMGVRVWDAR